MKQKKMYCRFGWSLLFGLFCALFLPCAPLVAQVLNDDIEQALQLSVNQVHYSSTAYCTVQKACVDESLTGKCIEYHNDQWFTFNSGNYGQLYINISGQECKKVLGVQLVVLKGVPCRPETYEVLACVSLANQDDIHVKLPPLEPNQDYLLNIDGYLHDFCSFGIMVGTAPQGISAAPLAGFPADAAADKDIVRISWELPDSLARILTGFEIWKRTETAFKSKLVQQVPVQRDVSGAVRREDYSFTDTLKAPGRRFQYRLVGVTSAGEALLLRDFQFARRNLTTRRKAVEFELKYKNGTPVTVLVFDDDTRKLLRSQNFNFDKKKHSRLFIETNSLLEAGVLRIQVEITDNRTRLKKLLFFDLE